MRTLYLDIETLPTADPAVIASLQVAAPVIEAKPPAANLKDKAKIEEAIEANRLKALSEQEAANAKALADSAEAVAKTALDAAFGRIAIIGFALDDERAAAWTATDHGGFDERALLEAFFNEFSSGMDPIRVVGHNIINFDLRFLVQRAVILGVRVPRWLPIAPRAWDENVCDTMTTWAGVGNRVSLDKLCRALGVQGKTAGIDGSKFSALWAEDPERAKAYCCDDVEAVRRVHRRMQSSLYNVA